MLYPCISFVDERVGVRKTKVPMRITHLHTQACDKRVTVTRVWYRRVWDMSRVVKTWLIVLEPAKHIRAAQRVLPSSTWSDMMSWLPLSARRCSGKREAPFKSSRVPSVNQHRHISLTKYQGEETFVKWRKEEKAAFALRIRVCSLLPHDMHVSVLSPTCTSFINTYTLTASCICNVK